MRNPGWSDVHLFRSSMTTSPCANRYPTC